MMAVIPEASSTPALTSSDIPSIASPVAAEAASPKEASPKVSPIAPASSDAARASYSSIKSAAALNESDKESQQGLPSVSTTMPELLSNMVY